MARHKSAFLVSAEYYPLWLLLGALARLPPAWSRALAKRLFQAVLRAMPARRELMARQISLCFPQWSESQKEQVAKRSLTYLAKDLAAYGRIPGMGTAAMARLVEIEGFEYIEAALRQKKGAITFTAHYGFWELMAIYVTRLYPDVSMVVRPLDNPKLDRLVTSIRGSGGGGVIDSRRVLKDGIRLLRRNGILGVLIDQNFHKGGVFVDFFGRPAATNTLVPILARRTGCAVLPMHNVWLDDKKIRIICEAPVALSQNPDQAAAIGEDAQALTRYVERWVREDPSQWLWLHNRWKRRPLPGDPIFGN